MLPPADQAAQVAQPPELLPVAEAPPELPVVVVPASEVEGDSEPESPSRRRGFAAAPLAVPAVVAEPPGKRRLLQERRLRL